MSCNASKRHLPACTSLACLRKRLSFTCCPHVGSQRVVRLSKRIFPLFLRVLQWLQLRVVGCGLGWLSGLNRRGRLSAVNDLCTKFEGRVVYSRQDGSVSTLRINSLHIPLSPSLLIPLSLSPNPSLPLCSFNYGPTDMFFMSEIRYVYGSQVNRGESRDEEEEED